MTRYLVTGGAGFIGSNIVRRLLARGDEVSVIDNFSSGRRENLADLLDRIRLVEGTICDADDVARAVDGADYVIHQAAIPSVQRSVENPFPTNDANINGTLTLLWGAHKAGVKRVVQASSSSVYGESPTLPKVEDMPPAPLSPYAVSKLTAEVYGQCFSRTYGLEVVSLRYFNVFGPHQDPASDYAAVIPKFISLMLEGRTPTIFGDGLQSRDFSYIDNVIQANIKACHAEGAGGGVFNIACGGRVSLLDLVSTLNEILGTSIVALHDDVRAGDIKHSQADIGQACEILGYEPTVDFAEGIAKTVDWYRGQA
jgi:nucleoside-diphosphate-sugar epimerase